MGTPINTSLGTLVAGLVAVALPLAARAECKRVHGHFASHPAPTCASPVGLCTEGELTGKLRGGYGFVMAQIIPPGDPTIPSVSFFTGTSTITTRRGVLTGTDAGAIDLNPFGFGKFSTLITLIGGDGCYTGAGGYLQIRGTLDFSTGGASGDYQGEVCTP